MARPARPRIRTLKPEIWDSEDFLELSLAGRQVFIYLISKADDHGRLKATGRRLTLMALAGTGVQEDEVEEQLRLMEARGMIVRYESRGARAIALCNWEQHQKVDHPAGSDIDPPPEERRAAIDHLTGGLTAMHGDQPAGAGSPGSGLHGIPREDSRGIALDQDQDRNTPLKGSVTAPAGADVRAHEQHPEPSPGPGWREGFREVVVVLNEACGRDFDVERQLARTGKGAALPVYIKRRKEGWSQTEICHAARGAAKDPNRQGNPQWCTPVSVLGSNIFDQLVKWGSGEEAPVVHLPVRHGGNGAEPQRRPATAGEARQRELEERLRRQRSAGA